jgi:hypothetical protein
MRDGSSSDSIPRLKLEGALGSTRFVRKEDDRFPNPINSSIAFLKVINPKKDTLRLRSSLRRFFFLF